MTPPPIQDPQEAPPAKPPQPQEPPSEIPPGNPRPDIPPPIDDPARPKQPQELPGNPPDEVPVRGPGGPNSPGPVMHLASFGISHTDAGNIIVAPQSQNTTTMPLSIHQT